MLKKRFSVVLALLVATVIGQVMPALGSWPVTVTPLSVSDEGVAGDQDTTFGQITPDGRYVVFSSWATTLVPGDTNGSDNWANAGWFGGSDAFVRDLVAGTIERVSTASDGTQGDYVSYGDGISGDGRIVLFSSGARNLTDEHVSGLFLKDRVSGTTTLISLAADGTPLDSVTNGRLSGDGDFITFASQDDVLRSQGYNDHFDLFIRNIATGSVELVSQPITGTRSDQSSWFGAISGDGRYVAFLSFASNLVPGDTNGRPDVFLRDRVRGTTMLVSKGLDNAPANGGTGDIWISPEGRWLAFDSSASNIVPGDTNGVADTFIYDIETGLTTRVMAPGNEEPDGQTSVSWITGHGGFLGVWSHASNLVENDTNRTGDSFIFERATGEFTRLSQPPDGSSAWAGGGFATISEDGRKAAFTSDAPDLVPNDPNNHARDLFLAEIARPLPDTTAPETVIDLAPNPQTASSSATFEFYATEEATFECSLDAVPMAACTSPHTHDGLAEGPHEFAVRATDLAGNTDSSTASARWFIDATAPHVQMQTPTETAFAPPLLPVDLSASASDPPQAGYPGTGVDSLCFKFYERRSDGSWRPLRCFDAAYRAEENKWTARISMESGTYKVSAHGTDRVGNQGKSATIMIRIF